MSSGASTPLAIAARPSRIAARIASVFGLLRQPPADDPAAREKLRVQSRAPAVTAQGFVDPRQRAGTRRIAVTLDQQTFDRIQARAKAEHISFAEAARNLIERGSLTSDGLLTVDAMELVLFLRVGRAH
jgi:hypothetical protein